jgi:CHAT domain-containing protein
VLNQSGDDERLTTQERAIILDAQALQLTGTILRLTGDNAGARSALTRSINQALAVRDGRVISIIRLRAQMIGELGLLEEAEGRTGEAEGRLQSAIQLLETEYPETMALAGARAKYAAFLTRHDRGDDALTIYRQVISALTLQRRQLTGLYNQMAPYYRMLVERQAVDPAATGEFFAAVQLLVRPGVADTQAVLARELSGGSGEAAGMFRQANTLARDLERARIDFARLAAQPDNPAAPSLQAELLVRIENLGAQQTATLTQLAQFPQYRAIEQDALTLPQLQGALMPGEAYVKLTVIGDKVYALLATQGTARAWQTGIDRDTLEASVDQIRDSISVYQGGQYNTFPFDAAAANQLYTALFSPVADQLGSIRHLIFEPDGAMMRLPVNLLITDAQSVAAYSARASAPGGDVFDMRGVSWLGRTTRVSTAVSALAFRNTRATAPSRAPRGYLGLGENAAVTNAASVAALRSASGVDASCSWDIGEWGKPISAAELNSARNIIGIGNAEIVTGAAFTDRRVRDRTDLNSFRILHFATHGFVTAPRDDCPTKPSLLTSFDSAESDGLLSFDEIFALRIDADLVILSACDTAGQASVSATRAAGITTGGGSALDGLVRAFIGAGGRSVLASHWPAPDDFQATERLITGLFHASPGTSIADALGQAQDSLMAEAATSHPYYWAGFAIIGDGSRPLIPAGTMAALSPAMQPTPPPPSPMPTAMAGQ